MSNDLVRTPNTQPAIVFTASSFVLGILGVMFSNPIAAAVGATVVLVKLLSGALFVIGLVLVFAEETKITVDQKHRKILVRKFGMLRKVSQSVPFANITGVRVRKRHSKDGLEIGYSLQIRTRNKHVISASGGLNSKDEFYAIAEELAEIPGVEKDMPYMLQPLPVNGVVLVLASLLFAQGVYALWYGTQTGWHFCPAMWYGSAPAIIIASVFFAVWRGLSLIRIRI